MIGGSRSWDDRPAVKTSTETDPHIDEELDSISSSAVASESGSLYSTNVAVERGRKR